MNVIYCNNEMITRNIFKGLITALITPFKDGELDLVALKHLLENQVKAGVGAVVIGGSTGEGNSLSFAEYKTLLNEAVSIAAKKIAIIGACSSSSTSTAIEISKAAQMLKIDGLMVTVPPYIKPMQEGIYQHFKAIHEQTNLPIMIYAIKSRTGIDIEDETIFRLAELPRILALKDSCANLERPLRISSSVKEEFNILAGDDELSLAFNAQGAKGCISVVSNIMPTLCKKLQDKWNEGKNLDALRIHQKLLPLYKALFLETNPTGIKYAAFYLGLCKNELRLPLLPATMETANKIKEAIKFLNE